MRIAVIGAGASAVCLLDALAERWETDARVTVFDPAPQPWCGRPYQLDGPSVKVNAPPSEMSVRDGDTAHFARWLDRRASAEQLAAATDRWSGDRFVSRGLYGAYLAETARAAVTALRRSGEVELRQVAVSGILRTAKQVVVRCADGRLQPFDACVMCVGVGPPADNYDLTGRPGFIADPYPTAAALGTIDPDADIAVLGSGLTAVDTVLALAASGHNGRITLASRSGVLPGVRQRHTPTGLRHFTIENIRSLAALRGRITLDEAAALMRAELRDGGHDVGAVERELLAVDGEDPRARLERQLAMVEDDDLGMRILQQAVPETGPDLWPALAETDKERVLGSHRRTLMSLCCPMPPASAAALLSLMDTGRLEVLGGLSDVRSRKGGFTLRTEAGRRGVKTVVNAAAAPAHRVPPGAAPVIDALVRSGAAVRHPHGGIRIDPATSRAIGQSGPDPSLYVLGDLAAGTLFFTFGIPSLVDRARDIVRALERSRDSERRALAVPTVTSNR